MALWLGPAGEASTVGVHSSAVSRAGLEIELRVAAVEISWLNTTGIPRPAGRFAVVGAAPFCQHVLPAKKA